MRGSFRFVALVPAIVAFLAVFAVAERPAVDPEVKLWINPSTGGPLDFFGIHISATNPGKVPIMEYTHEVTLPCGTDFREVTKWDAEGKYARVASFTGPVERSVTYGRTWWGARQEYLQCKYAFKIDNGKGAFPIIAGDTMAAHFWLQAERTVRPGIYYVYDTYRFVHAGREFAMARKSEVRFG